MTHHASDSSRKRHRPSIARALNVAALLILLPGFAGALSLPQRWAIALTELLTVMNQDTHEQLGTPPSTKATRSSYQELLKREWQVFNRQDLLDTILYTEINGHAATLAFMKKIIGETKDFSIFNLLTDYQLTDRQYNYLKFTLASWSIYKDRTILAWDYARIIALCRWGYSAGYLDEKEAWEKTMYMARKIQPLYQSWEDFGYDYYMGRIFWASGFSSEIEYLKKTDPIYKNLIGERGYWTSLDWNVPLGGK